MISACDGSDGADGIDGQDGADGSDGLNSLVAVRDIPVGDANCLGGGQALDSGLDTNRNGILDPSEITSSEYLSCAVTPMLRALHASPDAPLVNIWIDEAPALPNVDFNQDSGFVGVGLAENVTEDGANVNVRVEGILPGDATIDVLDATLPFGFGTETTVIATGSIQDDSFQPIIITNKAGEEIADGSFRAQVVHASRGAPAVDVPFGADTGVLKIQPGVTYDAFVTATGSTDAAITIDNFTPANGQVLEVIARDAIGEETLPQALIIDYDSVEVCAVAN